MLLFYLIKIAVTNHSGDFILSLYRDRQHQICCMPLQDLSVQQECLQGAEDLLRNQFLNRFADFLLLYRSEYVQSPDFL